MHLTAQKPLVTASIKLHAAGANECGGEQSESTVTAQREMVASLDG